MRAEAEEEFGVDFDEYREPEQQAEHGPPEWRLSHSDGTFTRQIATTAIPSSIPFLRSAVRLLADEDLLPPAILRLLDDLAALLNNTQIEPIREEVAAGGLERDLVVYFYEQFLEQYDKGERKRRGVYYTLRSSSAT